MLKSAFDNCGGANAPLLLLFFVLSAIFHFILLGMISLPHQPNQKSSDLFSVNLYYSANEAKYEEIHSLRGKANKENTDKKITEKSEEENQKRLNNKKKSVEKKPKEKKENLKPAKKLTHKNIVKQQTPDDQKNYDKDKDFFSNIDIERSMRKLPLDSRKAELTDRNRSEKIRKKWNKEDKKTYLEYVRRTIIDRIKYPTIARRRRIEGTVTIAFNIRKNGSLENIKLEKGSSYSILNNAAIETVNNIGNFKKPGEKVKVNIPINFTLK